MIKNAIDMTKNSAAVAEGTKQVAMMAAKSELKSARPNGAIFRSKLRFLSFISVNAPLDTRAFCFFFASQFSTH